MSGRKFNRVIVMEGPDGAGKSTLAKWLAESLGLELVHTGGAHANRQDFLDRESRLGFLTGEPKIYDRISYVSDLVYAFLNSRDPVVQPQDVNRFLSLVNPVIIYCRLSTAGEMLDLISEEKKAHKSPEYLEKIRISYPALVASYDKVIHDLQYRDKAFILRYNWKMDMPLSLKFVLDSLG